MLKASDHPEPTLQTTALRYAASDLSPGEATAFESRLADDQDARDALSEAVRLSAAALGQAPPTPDSTTRAAIRERLVGWCPDWLKRRAYRGHPLTWSGLGAAIVVVCTLVGISLAERKPLPTQATVGVSVPLAPMPNVPVPGVAIAPLPPETESSAIAITTTPACGETSTQSVAELWAQMSTPEHVEKAHDDEMRWRHKHHNATGMHTGRTHAGDAIREP